MIDSRNKKAKLIALCVKSVTAIIGSSMIIQNQHPYLTLLVLSIGAIANEMINVYKWNN